MHAARLVQRTSIILLCLSVFAAATMPCPAANPLAKLAAAAAALLLLLHLLTHSGENTHPNQFLKNRAIANLIVAATAAATAIAELASPSQASFCSSHLAWLNPLLMQFGFFAHEFWAFLSAMDVYLLTRDPFKDRKHFEGRYHLLAWGLAAAASACLTCPWQRLTQSWRTAHQLRTFYDETICLASWSKDGSSGPSTALSDTNSLANTSCASHIVYPAGENSLGIGDIDSLGSLFPGFAIREIHTLPVECWPRVGARVSSTWWTPLVSYCWVVAFSIGAMVALIALARTLAASSTEALRTRRVILAWNVASILHNQIFFWLPIYLLVLLSVMRVEVLDCKWAALPCRALATMSILGKNSASGSCEANILAVLQALLGAQGVWTAMQWASLNRIGVYAHLRGAKPTSDHQINVSANIALRNEVLSCIRRGVQLAICYPEGSLPTANHDLRIELPAVELQTPSAVSSIDASSQSRCDSPQFRCNYIVLQLAQLLLIAWLLTARWLGRAGRVLVPFSCTCDDSQLYSKPLHVQHLNSGSLLHATQMSFRSNQFLANLLHRFEDDVVPHYSFQSYFIERGNLNVENKGVKEIISAQESHALTLHVLWKDPCTWLTGALLLLFAFGALFVYPTASGLAEAKYNAVLKRFGAQVAGLICIVAFFVGSALSNQVSTCNHPYHRVGDMLVVMAATCVCIQLVCHRIVVQGMNKLRERAYASMRGALSAPAVPFIVKRPRTFLSVRRAHGTSDAALSDSIGSLRSSGGLQGGASGAFLFSTADNQFVLKTLTLQEVHALCELTPIFEDWFHKNPDSLINRFLGLYSMRMYGCDIHFVILRSIWAPCIGQRPRLCYDLKGSWVARTASSVNSILKDNDLRRDGLRSDRGMPLQLPLRLRFDLGNLTLKKLEADSAFLSSLGKMDYSLLVGVIDSRSDVRDDPCSGVLHTCDGRIILIGLIDVLQNWTLQKAAEACFKTWVFRRESSGISAIPPRAYRSRFLGFMRRILGSTQGVGGSCIEVADFGGGAIWSILLVWKKVLKLLLWPLQRHRREWMQLH